MTKNHKVTVMMTLTKPAMLAALLLLTACAGGGSSSGGSSGSGNSGSGGTGSGGTGSGGTGGATSEAARDYSENTARAAQIAAATAVLGQTPVASMPASGRAEYDGVVGMAFGAAPSAVAGAAMIGDLDLDANFATGRITGEMDDFDTSDGRALNGQLNVSNGTISGSTFTGTIAGNLTGSGTVPGAVNGTINGEFLGADAQAIQGTGTGSSTAGTVGLIFQGQRDYD